MASASGVRAGRAFVELFADDSRLVRGLNAAKAKLQAWAATVTRIGRGLFTAGAGILTVLTAIAGKFSDVGSDIKDMADRTGASIQALSGFVYAAGQTGAAGEDVEAAMRKWQKTMVDAVNGSKEARDAISDVGLSLEQLRHMSPEEQFRAAAKAIAAIPNPANRTAFAMQLMGKSATKLIPMFQQLVELEKEAKSLGLILSDEDAEKADALGDAWGRLKGSLTGVVIQIGAALAPLLTDIVDRTVNVVRQVIAWVGQNRQLVVLVAKLAAALVAAGVALMVIGPAISAVAAVIGAMAGVIVALSAPIGIFLVKLTAVSAILVLLASNVGHFSAMWRTFLNRGMQAVTTFGNVVLTTFAAIRNAIAAEDLAAAWEVAVSSMGMAWSIVANVIGKDWMTLKSYLLDGWAVVAAFMKTVVLNAVAAIQSAWVVAVYELKSIWFAVVSTFSEPIIDAIRVSLKAMVMAKNMFGALSDEQAESQRQFINGLSAAFKQGAPALFGGDEVKNKTDMQQQLRSIEGQRQAAVGLIDREQQQRLTKSRTDADSGALKLDNELNSAVNRFREAVKRANSLPTVPLPRFLKAQSDADEGIKATKGGSSTALGTFLASSVTLMGGSAGSALDRTARATEKSATELVKVRQGLNTERIG